MRSLEQKADSTEITKMNTELTGYQTLRQADQF